MAAMLFLPPPPVRSPAAAGSMTSRNNNKYYYSEISSTWWVRPPSRVSMSSTSLFQRNPTPPLRAVVLGSNSVVSRSPPWMMPSRRQTKKQKNIVPRAAEAAAMATTRMGNFFTGECMMNLIAFLRASLSSASGTAGRRQAAVMLRTAAVAARASLELLLQRVAGLVALAENQLWRTGLLSYSTKEMLLSQIQHFAGYFLMELVYREALTSSFSGMWGRSTLRWCGTDLTKLAATRQRAGGGGFDGVVGREQQMEQVVQILGRRLKNNPCLVGDPGVGKTAIVEGLAQLIAAGRVPDAIRGKRIVAVDVTGLLAGTVYRGQFESKMKRLLREVKRAGDVILFVDEVHTLVGAGSYPGSATDVADIFKPALARGELQLIGATTTDEYKKHIEKDAALERRFGPVRIPESTVDETVGILKGLRERYEKHHKVQYADDALTAAAELSHKYISDRFLPDKAIDLIDQAGSLASLRQAQQQKPSDVKDLEAELSRIIKEKKDAVSTESYKRAKELRDQELELKSLIDKQRQSRGTTRDDDEAKKKRHKNAAAGPVVVVTEEDIRHIVSRWTGVPVQKLSADETVRLLGMEEALHRRVVGQDEAVAAISRAVRRARAGLGEPGCPVGSFMFAGPTGVGKTELAKAVAAFYYGSEGAMVRIDMSEMMEEVAVAKLIGAAPGYVGHGEGGQLTEPVRRRPHTLVLLDEVEKAHPRVMDVLLQVLDDGRLTDAEGRTVDFRNTLIVMTSNVGGALVLANNDPQDGGGYDRVKELVGEEMRRRFRPEFLNRLDETVVFRQLARAQVKQIAGIMLDGVAARVGKKGIELQVTEGFKEQVVERGFDTSYGVRPLKRAILRLLEDALADKMLAGEIKQGDSVTVDVDLAGEVVFRHQAVHQA